MANEDGSIDYCNVPSIVQASNLSHEGLLSVLKLCPASDYFGAPRVILNSQTVSFKQAQRLVHKMIKQVTLDLIDKIPEVPSYQER